MLNILSNLLKDYGTSQNGIIKDSMTLFIIYNLITYSFDKFVIKKKKKIYCIANIHLQLESCR